MKQEFTMSIPNIPENYEALVILQEWSSKIPTLYFLDTCCVSHIKDSFSKNANTRLKVEKFVSRFRKYDLEQNGISYFPALIEKSSNPNCTRTVEQFMEEVNRDLKALKKFFQKAKIYEGSVFCKNYVQDCKGYQMETDNPIYCQFLEFANNLGLHNKENNKKKRLKLVETLCNRAEQLDIQKFHPVVLAVIGRIYGCSSAKDVLKFGGNSAKFDANNVLNDIHWISRVGRFSLLHNTKSRYLRTLFRTDDAGLEDFFELFTVKEVKVDSTNTGSTDAFTFSVEPKSIFPEIICEDGSYKGEHGKAEFEDIMRLIG